MPDEELPHQAPAPSPNSAESSTPEPIQDTPIIDPVSSITSIRGTQPEGNKLLRFTNFSAHAPDDE